MDALPLVNYWAHFVFSYRRLHGITQEQLAERLDVSQQTVSRWEAGQQLPDPGSQAKLRKVLGEADLNSVKHWVGRVRRASGYEVLLDSSLTFRSVSAGVADLARLLPEEMIGKTMSVAYTASRPKNVERIAEAGFFDGKVVHSKFTMRNNLGPRSFAYTADVWPALTSDSGILMHGCLYPFAVDHAPGVESIKSGDLQIAYNDLVGKLT